MKMEVLSYEYRNLKYLSRYSISDSMRSKKVFIACGCHGCPTCPELCTSKNFTEVTDDYGGRIKNHKKIIKKLFTI